MNPFAPLYQVYYVIFEQPTLNLLVTFFKFFVSIKLPGAFGFSIIALTVLIRFLLQPFFHKQMSTAKKMQEMKPHLDKLADKHKGDKARLQQEQLKLYQQAGINPASGCLFLLLQMPVFIAIYSTLRNFLIDDGLNKGIAGINKALYSFTPKIVTIDPLFFGFNLALSPQKVGVWYYYSIPLLTAFLQYYQVQVSMPSTPKESAPAEATPDKKDSAGDFQKAMNTQMKFIFPLLIGWFSFTLPVGLSLYWNIFSIFSIIQYRNLKK